MTEPQQWNIRYFNDESEGSLFLFDVVGESFCRDALIGFIQNATLEEREEGEIYKLADLVFEPTNVFDPNAIAVHMYGPRVGYIPKSLNAGVGQLMRRAQAEGANRFLVWGVIGWDTENPNPPVGVRLNLCTYDISNTKILTTAPAKPFGY
jgi:hypothetical protein